MCGYVRSDCVRMHHGGSPTRTPSPSAKERPWSPQVIEQLDCELHPPDSPYNMFCPGPGHLQAEGAEWGFEHG